MPIKQPSHSIRERILARGKQRRVWDMFDSDGCAVLEIISDQNGLHVFDGDGSKVAYVPQGETRNVGVEGAAARS